MKIFNIHKQSWTDIPLFIENPTFILHNISGKECNQSFYSYTRVGLVS